MQLFAGGRSLRCLLSCYNFGYIHGPFLSYRITFCNPIFRKLMQIDPGSDLDRKDKHRVPGQSTKAFSKLQVHCEYDGGPKERCWYLFSFPFCQKMQASKSN